MKRYRKLLAGFAGCMLIVAFSYFSMVVSNPSDTQNLVSIVKPKDGYLYIFDKEVMHIGTTLIIGRITIEVEAENIDGIYIYIDGQLKFSDYTLPYSCLWNEKIAGKHVINATACNSNESDEVIVYIFNFPKGKPKVLINEIMFDPKGNDAGKEWLELYNAGKSVKINGWVISNSDGNIIATLPNWVFPNNTYLVVYFGNGINDDDFSDGNATFYTGSSYELFDNIMDECALYEKEPSSKTIIDFVSYCYEGNYVPGKAYNYAVKAGIWNEKEYFKPLQTTPYSRLPTVKEGDSIGRDSNSNDTDTPHDWEIMGGRDAFSASFGRKNLDAFGIVNMEMAQIATTQIKKWTVMVYMADCDLERDFFVQLNQLEKIGTDNNINIVFQIDGWKNTREMYLDGNIWKSRNRGDAFRGFLFKDKNQPVNWNGLRVEGTSFVWAYNLPGDSAHMGEINTGSATSLRDFIEWVRSRAPANRYILILGGHGAGWKGLLIDESNGDDWLYMGELESALRGHNLDISIIGFDLCLMAMIEVAYQIRDWAQYMVASQELDRGWDYEDIFGHLQKNPDISSADLAKYMVESYHKTYANWDCHTLSAIDLGRLSRIYGGVRTLANHLKEGMEDWGDTEDETFKINGNANDNCQMDVKECLIATEHYHDRNYIDLYHFASLLGNNKNIYEGYKEGWEKIIEGIEGIAGVGGAVIANEHGINHPNSHGLSIYFPRHGTDYKNFIDCENKNTVDNPFDDPLPSRTKSPADDKAIYAEDKTIAWGKVPYIGNAPHPWPETPNFLWRDENINWDKFLHRYYKPCADAGKDITVEVECGEKATITLDGRGSSSADDDGLIREYIWDFDLQTNSDSFDADRDGVDEYNDDRDATGPTPTHEFSPGTYIVTLTVWDDHYLKNSFSTNNFPNEHWKTDQDIVVIRVIEKPCPDSESPNITITEPPDNSEFDEPNITVSGIATDDVGIVEVGYNHVWEGGEKNNSWAIDNLTSYEFIININLHAGSNKIEVYAKDGAGNIGNDSITIFYYPDTNPPITEEEVGQPSWEEGYIVTAETPIWLNSTDDLSGVNYIYYEIWWDSDGDGVIETEIYKGTVYETSIEIYFGNYEIYSEITELRFYAVDNAGNMEEMKIKQHLVQ